MVPARLLRPTDLDSAKTPNCAFSASARLRRGLDIGGRISLSTSFDSINGSIIAGGMNDYSNLTFLWKKKKTDH